MRYRVGINLGDIIEKADGSVYGDGVNIAARPQSLAGPGGIMLSGKVHDEVEGRVDVGLIAAGEHKVKNIARLLRAYRVVAPDELMSEAQDVDAPPVPDKPSIVVLPFDNMSADEEQDYFADGITEDLITDLSKVSGLFVIARNSSFTYKGKPVNLTKVGRELGVRTVLEGSVRKAGRSAEAIDDINYAIRLDPLLPDVFLHFLAQCHFALGDDEGAVRVLRRRITRQPETDVSRVLLAAALGHLGRHEEARHEWARARAINPGYSLTHKRAILPYRDTSVFDRMAEGLAKAGIETEEAGGG